MAPSTPNTGLADQLVASLLPVGVPASKLRKHRDVFSRKLKTHTYARTNQFEVAERLDTLQEKLQILNNDELSDAIHARLVKLKDRSEKWLPDVLDLILRLADDPINKSKVEWLENISALPVAVPSLTWAELNADDPVYRKDPIWSIAAYSDLSSDDDIVEVEHTTPDRKKTSVSGEEEVASQVQFDPVDIDAGQKALDGLYDEQFWHHGSDEPVELTELQVIREVLFMLQGLPTALFWKVGENFEVDKRLRLQKTSQESFLGVIADFSQLAIRLDALRTFTKRTQTVRVMQTLCSILEDRLLHIDKSLYTLQEKVLSQRSETPATLLQLFESANQVARASNSYAVFVEELESLSADNVQCLECLFDRVCQVQITGNEPGFHALLSLFFQCFKIYFQPVKDWMDHGTVPEKQDTVFVTAFQVNKDPSSLWQKWYKLAEDSAANRCPNFLQSVKSRIFNIGKTIIFLKRLGSGFGTFNAPWMLSSLDSFCSQTTSLLPFSELFAINVEDFVESRLQIVTSALRDRLGKDCGLWKTLDALENIYFGKNGYMTDLVDAKLFNAIDRCNKTWCDRFLLGDYLRSSFAPIECIEADRLSVISTPYPSRNMSHRRQSVKLLKDLRIQYTLPWSIANIITRASFATYYRISTLLIQIRRARFMLERRCLLEVRSGRLSASLQETNLNHLLHHDLLLFVNTLYSHLTNLVIEQATSRLRQDFTNAPEIDAMTTAHSEFCHQLEDACLTSKKLKQIHDELISILDLCIRFSDLNNPSTTQTRRPSSDVDVNSFISATSHQRRRDRKVVIDDSSSEGESSDGEGYSTFIVPEESTLLVQLKKLRGEFDSHLSFIVAGLKSIGMVEERGSSWEILGSRLDWNGNFQSG